LTRSLDVKRKAVGISDSISAVDIRKFPDTNLAESIQRISGVSIERVDNEGSKISVRGFGPNFNLITLNGRQMPASTISRSSDSVAAAATRAFDFANKLNYSFINNIVRFI